MGTLQIDLSAIIQAVGVAVILGGFRYLGTKLSDFHNRLLRIEFVLGLDPGLRYQQTRQQPADIRSLPRIDERSRNRQDSQRCDPDSESLGGSG